MSSLKTWWCLVALFSGVAAGCLDEPTGPTLVGGGRRALFIGNSYLYTMDIPGLVQALADSAGGDSIAVATVAFPDFALIDHWREGTARREIAKGGWEWVILQQGPSSVGTNRDSLRIWSKLFADFMTEGTPALFSAWPSSSRRGDFANAIESYRLAAVAVDGLFLPVASAWLAAWRFDANMQLYQDGLHPSAEGAYLSAATVYGALLGQSPLDLPDGVRTRGGLTVIIEPARAQLLRQAAAEALAQLR